MVSNGDPLGVLTIFIFDIALVSSWRPGTLYNLEFTDVVSTEHRAADLYKISSRTATPNGSKTAHAGPKSVLYKPMTVTIWRSTQLDGIICVIDDM